MSATAPPPVRLLAWLLQVVSSRDAASATIGDLVEEFETRTAAGRRPRYPALWINVQTARALVTEFVASAPRLFRSSTVIVRDAVRAIRAAPAHSLFIVIVLAAGITLGTVTYSVVDAVVLRPLPIDHAERLVFISTRDEHFTARITPDQYWRLHDQLGSVEGVGVTSMRSGEMVTVAGTTDEMTVMGATADALRILRLSPVIGRLWTAEDERGTPNVAVLGYRYWRERFGGDPSVLGATVTEGKWTFSVIGVLSAESDHPGVDLTSAPVWVPIAVPHTSTPDFYGGLLARMRPGVSTEQIADDVQRILATPDWRPTVTQALDSYVARFRTWMLLALGAAAMVILVACANAANLMLTRSAHRAQELAIRASLGASCRQMALTVLVEGLLLSGGATALALLLSIEGVRVAKVAVTSAQLYLFRAPSIALNGRVLLAAIACAAVTGVLCALVPAWQTSRAPLGTLLKDAEAPTSTSPRRWRSAFLTAEVATVVVLLVVSWLFVVSLIRVDITDLGIDRANLLAVNPRLKFQASVDEVRDRVSRVPGVTDVAVSTGASLPLIGRAYGGAWITTTLRRADGTSDGRADAELKALEYRVTPNYFSVAGLRFIRGGTLPSATGSGSSAIVLDAQAARRLFGADDPLGRQVVATEPAGSFTVVGTVPHVYARGAEEDEWPSAYFALAPNPARTFAGLFVRTSRPPEEMLPVVSEALQPIGPNLKEPFVFVADEAVRKITATRRFNAEIMSVFGLIGVVIAAAGVYAVMASFVAQQTREIGVRLALGATPARVERGVFALALRHLAVGLALGAPIAWWLSRGFATLLFGVTPADVSVYAGVGVLLCAVGCLAAFIPARRAANIDPIISLKR